MLLNTVNVHSVNCLIDIMSTVVPFRSQLLYVSKQRGSLTL